MTNLELIEYLKICTGKEIVKPSDYGFIENVLKSNISIKDILIDFEKLSLDYRFKMNFLRKLYKEDDKTIECILNTIHKLVNDYGKLLGYDGLSRHFKNIFGYQCNKNVIIWDMNKLRIIKLSRRLKLDNRVYIVSCYKDDEESFISLKSDTEKMNNIRGIIFKDNKYKLEYNKCNWLDMIKTNGADFILIPINVLVK